jgi:hypothetical protein
MVGFIKKFNLVLKFWFYTIKLKLVPNYMFFFFYDGWIKKQVTKVQYINNINDTFEFVDEIYFYHLYFFAIR